MESLSEAGPLYFVTFVRWDGAVDIKEMVDSLFGNILTSDDHHKVFPSVEYTPAFFDVALAERCAKWFNDQHASTEYYPCPVNYPSDFVKVISGLRSDFKEYIGFDPRFVESCSKVKIYEIDELLRKLSV